MNWVNLIASDIITVIGIYFFIKNLSGQKFTKKSIIIFLMLLSFVLLIDTLLFDILTKNIFNILMIIFISYYTIFNKNLGTSVYYSLLFAIFNCAMEIAITAVLVTIFKYSTNSFENSQFSMLLLTISVTLVLLLTSKIPYLQSSIRKIEKKVINNIVTKLYIIIFTIFIVLLVTNNYLNYERNINYYINIVMLIFVIMVTIIILHNKITKDNIELQYKEMMEYVSKYEKIINEQGKKNHEFNNQLMVLNGYIGNEEKLREYLETIVRDHKGGKNYTIEQLSYFPDGGIKGLIYHKLSRMEENEIKPYLYIDKNVKDIFETKFDVNMYSDITKMFGVFLDNAIEAAKEADKKEIEIDMKIDGNYLIVSISNTYSKGVDLDKVGKKGFTTKGVGHGFGLSLVKDISKKNDKVDTFNDVTNDMFKQTIMIDLK